MTPSLVVPELVIVIAVPNHNPQTLNPEFLKNSGIVPVEWELARQPICSARGSSVTYANGISIVAEPQRIMFVEAMDSKATSEVTIPAIASKYVQTLPHMEYQAVGLNPRGFATFVQQPDAARNYISETLFSQGAWQEVGIAPMRATVNLAYTLDRCAFNLGVNEAFLRQSDETTTTPIVLFSGNFNYDMAGKTGNEKLVSLCQALENWQADLETYKDIINTKFLTKIPQAAVVMPDLLAMSASAI